MPVPVTTATVTPARSDMVFTRLAEPSQSSDCRISQPSQPVSFKLPQDLIQVGGLPSESAESQFECQSTLLYAPIDYPAASPDMAIFLTSSPSSR